MINNNNIWQKCLEELSSTLTEKDMRVWIKPLKVEHDTNEIKLYAPNKFVKEEVEKNFFNKILSTLGKMNADILVTLNIGANIRSREVARDLPIGFKTNLNKEMTFETFVEGKSNQLAKAACLSVIKEPGVLNPLYIYGGVGLGKTHLLHSIGNQLSSEDKKVVYLHSEKFVQNMVTALRNNQMEEFKKFYRNLNALLIDDIQFFAGKEGSQEELFHTFNSLIEGGNLMIFSCDRYPKEIEGLEERLKSRFGWGLSVVIDPPGLETRAAILLQKAEQMNLALPSECAFFIAQQVKSNVRELEGALKRVAANAKFAKTDIDITLVKDSLRDILAIQAKMVTIPNIQRVVADYYNIKTSELLSKRRNRSITRPRQIAMALSKELTNHSLPEIGDAFGGRDHTTVIHACEKTKELTQESLEIEEDYKKLRRYLST